MIMDALMGDDGDPGHAALSHPARKRIFVNLFQMVTVHDELK
jgi:hypothetical protein